MIDYNDINFDEGPMIDSETFKNLGRNSYVENRRLAEDVRKRFNTTINYFYGKVLGNEE